MTPDLIGDLIWWFKNLELLPVRAVSLRMTPNNLIYPDAPGDGGSCIGTILIPADQTADTPVK